jgi:hypothetical protein
MRSGNVGRQRLIRIAKVVRARVGFCVRGWTTIAGESLYQGFYLKDEFGYVWVHPKGADYDTVTLLRRVQLPGLRSPLCHGSG